MRANVAALCQHDPHGELLRRFHGAAQALTGSVAADIGDGIAFVDELSVELGVPGLAAYGMRPSDIREIAGKAAAATIVA